MTGDWFFPIHSTGLVGLLDGTQKQMPLYRFVAEALRKKFGSDWYVELERVASEQNKKQ
jgi:hypothetical protein